MAFCQKQYHSNEDLVAISGLLKSTGAVEIKEVELESEITPNLFKSGEDAHIEEAHHH